MSKKGYKKGIIIGILLLLAAVGSVFVIRYVDKKEIPTAIIVAQGDVGTNSILLEEEYLSKNTRELLYESLEDEDMKELYITVRDCIINFEASVETPSASRTDINNILYAVLGDHPEIFWLGGYEYNLGVFTPIYSVTANQKTEMERNIREQASIILNEAVYVDGLNSFEKAKMIYDYIINNTVYAESDRDQEIDSVILNHESVCSGYAKTFAYLMDRLHIPCCCINSNSHMYNIIELDGVLYLVDVTGGDGFEVAGYGNYPDYSYFICSNEELCNSPEHQPINICELLQYSCTDTGRNYYTEYGTYVEEWKQEYIDQMAEKLEYAGIASIKCSNEEMYDTVLSAINESFTEEDSHIIPNATLKTITVIRF